MSAHVPRQVLSEALHSTLRGRAIKAAVFTTFTFEPGFFEREVLPVLFDQPFSHADKVKLVQLEEALREVPDVSVYYDARGLKGSDESAGLDVRRFAMHRKGYFHPKVALLLVENETDTLRWESLVVQVASANLTRAGWWDNVEATYLTELQADRRTGLKDGLLELCSQLRGDTLSKGKHVSLRRIRKFINDLPSHHRRMHKGRYVDTLFAGQNQKALPDFLADHLQSVPAGYNLEVLSPYFEQGANAATLRSLIDALEPAETRVYLPREDDGSALCKQAFYKSVASLLNTQWGRLRGSIRRRSSQTEKATDRFVHAKVFRLWSSEDKREILVVGSANLTAAAFSQSDAGNLEASAVFESDNTLGLSWWLDVDSDTPSEFREEAGDDELPDTALPHAPLDLHYSWEAETLEASWHGASDTSVELRVQDIVIGTLTAKKRWTEQPPELAQALRAKLSTTSYVHPYINGQRHLPILVRESGMAHKPSVLHQLTPEEIMRYWSLLTDAQRHAFIESKAYQLLVAEGLAPPRTEQAEPESFFGKFAGIFHAFSQLESHLTDALNSKRDKVAEYRLFGRKYDSLHSLIDKVVEGESAGDLVDRYITLLTAKQLLARLRAHRNDFWTKHDSAYAALVARIEEAQALQTQIDVGDDHRKFFKWFEKEFLRA